MWPLLSPSPVIYTFVVSPMGFIYAPCSLREKEQLWIVIEGLLVNAFGSIRCMIGDFNSVRSTSERKRITSGVSNKRDMVKFNELIDNGSNPKRVVFWNPIIDKIKSRLSS